MRSKRRERARYPSRPPEIDHAVDDEVRNDQRDPSVNERRDESPAAGQFAKIVPRKQSNRAIEDERHGGEKPRRQSPFGAQRLDLELQGAALAHEGREAREHRSEERR